MRIVIGSDKSGFELKEAVKKYLQDLGHELLEVGTTDPTSPVPFYAVAPEAAKLIQGGQAERGILVCGTGMGMAQVAGSSGSRRLRGKRVCGQDVPGH